MRINHNIAALNTYRQLNSASEAQSKSMEKLSSGLRINKAGDDAAGLAISEKMRGQIRGLDMASKNAQDATSMIQTAEGALNETHDILQRMRELSVQASNDTNTVDDREEIQKEINQMTSEINRIGNTTEFNTKKLLNGDLSSQSKVAGSDKTIITAVAKDYSIKSGASVTSTNGGLKLTDNQLKVEAGTNPAFDWTSIDATNGTNQVSITKQGDDLLVSIAGQDTTGNKIAVTDKKVSLSDDGKSYTYKEDGISFSISKEDFAAAKEGAKLTFDLEGTATGATATAKDATGTLSTVNDISVNEGSTAGDKSTATITGNKITIGDDAIKGAAKVEFAASGVNAADGKITVTIKDKDGNALSTDEYTMKAAQTGSFTYDNHGVSFAVDFGATTKNFSFGKDLETTSEDTFETNDKSATFQIGANENQSMSLSFSDMRAKALGITGSGDGFSGSANVTNGTNNDNVENALDVTSASNAAKAITTIDKAIKSVSQERSKLGATQNRLEHTINNLSTSSENLTAAESRIRDVDMAKEMMNQTKNSILSQAAQAMLAQANQQPQGVLQLLR